MSKSWPMVPLGEVLNHRKEFIEINDLEIYKRCRVQLHAQGIVLRDTVSGAEIKTKKQQVCKAGEFLVAEIDAKVGGFGIMPDELEGAIVSSHYFLFKINEALLSKRFFNYYIRTPYFRDQVAAQGSTNYAAIRPKDVLGYKIPLPPLPEQKRIAGRIGQLAAKVEEAHFLKQAIEVKLEQTLLSTFYKLIDGAELQPMEEVAPITRRSVEVTGDGVYPEMGIRSFGKGTFHKPALNGIEVGTKRLYGIEPNDLVFSNVFAWEGAVAVAKQEDSGRVGSHRFIACVPKEGVVTSSFLCFYFLTREGIDKLGDASPGGAGRNRTLGLKALGRIKVPVPPYKKQIWFDGLQAKVDTLKQLQAETSAELDAMLPSILDKAFKDVGNKSVSLHEKTYSTQEQQPREMTHERSAKIPLDEFVAKAYPSSDADRAICAATLAVVEQSGGLSSMEHLDTLLLATHPGWCKAFLDQNGQRALETAMRSAPKALFINKDRPILWKECRDYLEKLGALTVARKTADQTLHVGTAIASIKASLPAGVDKVVTYALASLDRIRELRKDSASVSQAQRNILDAFSEQHRQHKLTA